MNRKPRSDSKLDALTPQQREQLCSWLTIENRSYAEVKALAREHFDITTSDPALVAFYSRVAAPWKYAQARGEADTFEKLMEGKFDAATIKRAKQLAFESMSGPRPDLKAAKTLLKIIGDSAKLTLAQDRLGLDARKVALLEQKAALADEAKLVAGNKNLTPDEQLSRYKQIFGGA